MSLISVVIGIGLGMFAHVRPGERVAISVVENLLRSARNSAVARNAIARVRIDREAGALTAEGMHVIGTWHFEEEPVRGAFELDGASLGFDGSALVEDGFQGMALSFVGHPSGVKVEIPVHNDPAYDFTRGFAVDFALRIEPKASGRLITIGKSVYLETSSTGALRAYFVPTIVDENGAKRPAGKAWIESPAGVLAADRWSKVRLVYDLREFQLLVDGVVVTSAQYDAPVWEIDDALVLGGGQRAYQGTIDNLVIEAVGVTDEETLPDDAEFEESVPQEIVFAAGGALERALHAGALEFSIRYEDGRKHTFHINSYGTVE